MAGFGPLEKRTVASLWLGLGLGREKRGELFRANVLQVNFPCLACPFPSASESLHVYVYMCVCMCWGVSDEK